MRGWLSPDSCSVTKKGYQANMSLWRLSFTVGTALLCGASAFAQAPTCNETLWKHVYNQSRLVVQQSCVTVTGTVVDATANEKTHEKDGVRRETDGDSYGWLKLDQGQEKFINDANKQSQGGNLVFEIICQNPTKQGDAKTTCTGLKNAVKVPSVGSHVAITGTWVLDGENGNGWFEIHPVTSITVVKQ